MVNSNLEQLLSPPGSTLYYALSRTPARQRSHCLALFGLYRELHKLVFSSSETVYVKSGWWYEELERMLTGTPRHPVTREIASCNDRRELQALAWLEALQPYFKTQTIDNEAHVAELSENLALPLFRGVAGICGHRDSHSETLRNAASAYVLFEFVQEFGHFLRADIVPIPETDLQRCAVSSQHLRDPESAEFQSVMKDQCARILALLKQEQSGPPHGSGALPCQLGIINAINLATLLQIKRSHYALVNTRIDLTPLRKAWITWKTMRNYRI